MAADLTAKGFGYVNIFFITFKCNFQFIILQTIAGFCELIPNHLLRPFDERELELVIGGISSIDVADWKAHTRLKHCTHDTPQVQWFWQVASGINPKYLRHHIFQLLFLSLTHRLLNRIRPKCVPDYCNL